MEPGKSRFFSKLRSASIVRLLLDALLRLGGGVAAVFLAAALIWFSFHQPFHLLPGFSSHAVSNPLNKAGYPSPADTVGTNEPNLTSPHQAKMMYRVRVDGQTLGFVSDPNVIAEYLNDRQNQLNTQYPNLQVALKHGDLQVAKAEAGSRQPDDDSVIQELSALVTAQVKAVALKVNGQTVGYVENQSAADQVLKQVKAHFALSVGAQKGKADGKVQILSVRDQAHVLSQKVLDQKSEFIENVATESAEVQPSQLSDASALTKKLETGGVKPVTYTVQDGDCISCIAHKFQISQETIHKDNPWIKHDMLHIGDVLNLTAYQPILSVQTTEVVKRTEAIPFTVNYVSESSLPAGQEHKLRSGKDGERLVTDTLTMVNGVMVSSHQTDVKVTVQPVSAKYARGTKMIGGLYGVVQHLLGVPYRWGGTTSSGFDCSGFTRYVFAQYGIHLPRTAAGQAEVGVQVSRSHLRTGDLVFFHTYGPSGSITHVGIYLGSGRMANAVTPDVEINDIGESYFSSRYITARRVFSDKQYEELVK